MLLREQPATVIITDILWWCHEPVWDVWFDTWVYCSRQAASLTLDSLHCPSVHHCRSPPPLCSPPNARSLLPSNNHNHEQQLNTNANKCWTKAIWWMYSHLNAANWRWFQKSNWACSWSGHLERTRIYLDSCHRHQSSENLPHQQAENSNITPTVKQFENPSETVDCSSCY